MDFWYFNTIEGSNDSNSRDASSSAHWPSRHLQHKGHNTRADNLERVVRDATFGTLGTQHLSYGNTYVSLVHR